MFEALDKSLIACLYKWISKTERSIDYNIHPSQFILNNRSAILSHCSRLKWHIDFFVFSIHLLHRWATLTTSEKGYHSLCCSCACECEKMGSGTFKYILFYATHTAWKWYAFQMFFFVMFRKEWLFHKYKDTCYYLQGIHIWLLQ